MIEFLTASANFPFFISLCLMIAIAVIEALGLVLGMGISSIFDNLLPDIQVDINAPEVPAASPVTALFDWFLVGKVPILILFVIFLSSFGMAGFFIQSLWMNITGVLLPTYIASVPALMVSFPIVRYLGKGVSKIMPTEETSALSEDSFIGKVATITIGKARKNNPAEARFDDEYGQTHYVMVAPDIDGEEFEAGDKVLIIEQNGSLFLVRQWLE